MTGRNQRPYSGTLKTEISLLERSKLTQKEPVVGLTGIILNVALSMRKNKDLINTILEVGWGWLSW